MSNQPLPLQFVMSAQRGDQLPEMKAEVAFIGRSNVGKSSLVNAITGRKSLAKTSKTPGRTQLLNCFSTDNGFALIDCPGYGYAKVSRTTREAWSPMIRGYLRHSETLRATVVLVDGEIGPTKLDIEMLEWLSQHDLAFQVIATKHDKVKSSKREKRKKELAAGCGLEQSAIIWVSATTGVGIDRLRTRVRELWGAAG